MSMTVIVRVSSYRAKQAVAIAHVSMSMTVIVRMSSYRAKQAVAIAHVPMSMSLRCSECAVVPNAIVHHILPSLEKSRTILVSHSVAFCLIGAGARMKIKRSKMAAVLINTKHFYNICTMLDHRRRR